MANDKQCQDDESLREGIVRHEWEQFQQVNNEGGPANCQGNWPMFHQMRLSQFLTWPHPLLASYADDLDQADAQGRNLLTEKYGRMMESTAPDQYHSSIAPYCPGWAWIARSSRSTSSTGRWPGPRTSASATPV